MHIKNYNQYNEANIAIALADEILQAKFRNKFFNKTSFIVNDTVLTTVKDAIDYSLDELRSGNNTEHVINPKNYCIIIVNIELFSDYGYDAIFIGTPKEFAPSTTNVFVIGKKDKVFTTIGQIK